MGGPNDSNASCEDQTIMIFRVLGASHTIAGVPVWLQPVGDGFGFAISPRPDFHLHDRSADWFIPTHAGAERNSPWIKNAIIRFYEWTKYKQPCLPSPRARRREPTHSWDSHQAPVNIAVLVAMTHTRKMAVFLRWEVPCIASHHINRPSEDYYYSCIAVVHGALFPFFALLITHGVPRVSASSTPHFVANGPPNSIL